jgi:CheY-like chemotaxis protein/HPt (histidine-containing phosphotransfer) domain-containing protein
MDHQPTTATDITNLRGVRVLAGAISRNIRTPLHSVQGFLELLALSGLDEKQRDTFAYIMRDTDTLARAADRLLLLCQLLGNERTSREDIFDLPELLGEATTAVRGDIRTTIDRRVPTSLIGDADDLRHVLMELLDNAARHVGGPVTLAVLPDGPIAGGRVPLRISIVDDGGGLPDAQLAFVDTPTAVPSGGGLGLYLVTQLLTRLDGRLHAERPPGHPSSVSVHVTVKAAPAPFALEPSTPGKPAGTTALRVLLVEDNPVNLTLAQRQMKVLGHELETATRGEQGVNVALSGEFDVILMDRHLPDLDGVEATRQIRAVEVHTGRRRTPIFAVTADAMPRNRDECLAAGMDGFLTKPVDIEVLRATLDDLAGQQPAEVADDDVAADDVLDIPTLYGVAGPQSNHDNVVERANAFLAELPGRRMRLQHAIRNADARDIVTNANALAERSTVIGAHKVAELCKVISDAAREGDTHTTRDTIPHLRTACLRTAAALSAHTTSMRRHRPAR